MDYKRDDLVKIVKVSVDRCSHKDTITNSIGKEVRILKVDNDDLVTPIKVELFDSLGDRIITWLYDEEFTTTDSFEVICIDSEVSSTLIEGVVYTVVKKIAGEGGIVYYMLHGYGDYIFISSRFDVKNIKTKNLNGILKSGNKATHKDLECKYIYLKDDKLYDNDNKEYSIRVTDLYVDEWEVYNSSFESNVSLEKGQYYKAIDKKGKLYQYEYRNDYMDNDYKDNFNMFDNEEYANYISRKNKLQRQMEMFAYLNNDRNQKSKYYISSWIDKNNKCIIESGTMGCKFNVTHATQFTSIEVADECLRLYKKDIEEVLRMKKAIFNI